jgi:hypothetical protein
MKRILMEEKCGKYFHQDVRSFAEEIINIYHDPGELGKRGIKRYGKI